MDHAAGHATSSTRPSAHYEQHHPNDLDALKHAIRKGDVLLVDGNLRVSVLIKYLTHSPWSHAALYVGDELLRRGGALRALAQEHFGDEARARDRGGRDGRRGRVAALEVRRSQHAASAARTALRGKHLVRILDGAIGAIGWRYDLRNVIDLALHLGAPRCCRRAIASARCASAAAPRAR